MANKLPTPNDGTCQIKEWNRFSHSVLSQTTPFCVSLPQPPSLQWCSVIDALMTLVPSSPASQICH